MSITAIVGKPGAGKTSFMTALLFTEAFNPARIALQKREVSQLKIDCELPKVPTAQNYPVTFRNGVDLIKSPQFDAEKIGVPALDENAICFAPYSAIGICEAQTVFNSHKWQQFTYAQSAFFEWSRHWGLDIFLDCQIPCLLNQNIRALATVIEIDNREVFDIHRKLVKRGFYVREADFGFVRWTYTKYETIDDYEERKNGKKGVFEIVQDVFTMYNERERRTQFCPQKGKGFLI